MFRSGFVAAAAVGGLVLVSLAGTASQANPNPHAPAARPAVHAAPHPTLTSTASPGHILGPSRDHMTTMCGGIAGV
jgi:hypothetical protein